MFLCFIATYSTIIIFVAIQFNIRQIMNMLVSTAALLLCVLVFMLVTGVNPRIEIFVIVLMIMNGANCYIFTKIGQNTLEDSLQISGVSLFYVTHFMHRLGLAVGGHRLDINKSDYIYAALVNFMDVPYYAVGLVNYVLPVARWTSLNADARVGDLAYVNVKKEVGVKKVGKEKESKKDGKDSKKQK